MRPALLAVVVVLVAAWGLACAPASLAPTVNQPPVPVLLLPERAGVGESVDVDGNGSTDVDGAVSEATLLFGDGTDPVGAFSAAHAWSAPGLYLVELYVADDDAATARARARITIEPP